MTVRTEPDLCVAVVVTVPEEHFHDDDDLCLAAGSFVCAKLRSHLAERGHSIPAPLQNGCQEDWGVYFESVLDGMEFDYSICFFPGPAGTVQNQMMVQYRGQRRRPFLKRLFHKPDGLSPDDPMHQTMRSFGELFSASRLLTQAQFEEAY